VFLLESHYPELKIHRDAVERKRRAMIGARGRGLIPVREWAALVGITDTGARNWVRDGCPHLPQSEKPKHEWVGELEPVLFIAKSEARRFKASLPAKKRAMSAAKYYDRPDGRYIAEVEARRRIGCSRAALYGWATGKSPVPGGAKLRGWRPKDLPGAKWFYHEEDVALIVKAPKGQRGRYLNVADAWLDARTGKRVLSTRGVARICGVEIWKVHRWGDDPSKTPNGLPFTRLKRTRDGRSIRVYFEDQSQAIASALSGDVPANGKQDRVTETAAPPVPVIILSPRAKECLDAMLLLGAVSPDTMTDADHIATKVVKGASGDSYKRQMAELVKAGLAESKRGRGGGTWLTAAGVERAKG
jgi:hypothetical protein